MNRYNIQIAIWLDESVKTLESIESDAKHYSQCRFELNDNIGKDVYGSVKNIIQEAINKINLEFEKL